MEDSVRNFFCVLLLSFLVLPAAEASSLRLYFLPTFPARLDWQSPKALINSALNGLIRNRTHPIGHVNVEVACDGEAPLLAGATGAGAGPISDLLMSEKVGFSLLERGWRGSHEDEKKILESFAKRGRDPRQLAVVTYDVAPATCARLKEYLLAYRSEVAAPFYGFAPRPRRKEGAGCSAFGASFLEVAGFLDPGLQRAWTLEKRVPLALMAGHAGRTEVSIHELRTSPLSARWAEEGEPHMLIELFDPDSMYEWARRLAADPAELAAWGGTLDADLPHGIAGVPALRFDRTHVPTPREAVFNGEPALVPRGPTSRIREGLRYAPDGSFRFPPW